MNHIHAVCGKLENNKSAVAAGASYVFIFFLWDPRVGIFSWLL